MALPNYLTVKLTRIWPKFVQKAKLLHIRIFIIGQNWTKLDKIGQNRTTFER